ncbi:hypothetical protein [Tunturiibacter lichenicola]|uniref:hypothetical protein n=1 Tax=Tunturiibacter lichenicola TaxID=2051959 RepID=UPI0021B394DE|nr:hypothetical protein [Edaphobacter lichenicola]
METESGRTIVIAAYKPKPGKYADLLQLTREHVATIPSQPIGPKTAPLWRSSSGKPAARSEPRPTPPY